MHCPPVWKRSHPRPVGKGGSGRGGVTARLLAVLVLLLLAHGMAGGPGQASPLRTLLHGGADDPAADFAAGLAGLWRTMNELTSEELRLQPLPLAENRLDRVQRRQADFAIVTASLATRRLGAYSRLVAVAVLWPEVLHAVARNPTIKELPLQPAGQVSVFGGAGGAPALFRRLAEERPELQLRMVPKPLAALPAALEDGSDPLLVFFAPVPLLELSEALRQQRNLRLVPVSNDLLQTLLESQPWLVSGKVGRGSYPGQRANLELPVHHRIMIGRRDLPRKTVRKMLRAVYNRRRAMRGFNALFGLLDGNMNSVFAKLLQFHPATERAYGFVSSVP